MWPPRSSFPVEPPPQRGWWVELSLNRWVDGFMAERREAEEAMERSKRIRRLRRRVERIDEMIVIAEGAAEARGYRRRQLAQHGGSHQIGSWGAADARASAGDGEVEHSPHWGQILGVR